MGRVDNKVALVTGGAKGIGRASALMLAREGARVVLTDVEEAQGTAVAREIERAGGKALFLVQDVTDESQWVDVVDRARAHFGGLNIVVNNAGIGTAGSAEDETLEAWRRLMAVNLDGVFLGTKHAIRAMKDEAGAGSIINISSIEGIVADPKLAAYNASKGGVRLFSRSAAIHCARSGYNIRVNNVCPGFAETQMVSGALATLAPADAQAFAEKTLTRIPMGRFARPAEIAAAVLFLASDESSYVTGSDLVVDGGMTA